MWQVAKIHRWIIFCICNKHKIYIKEKQTRWNKWSFGYKCVWYVCVCMYVCKCVWCAKRLVQNQIKNDTNTRNWNSNKVWLKKIRKEQRKNKTKWKIGWFLFCFFISQTWFDSPSKYKFGVLNSHFNGGKSMFMMFKTTIIITINK